MIYFGLIVSIAYVGTLVLLRKDSFHTLLTMDLNNLGDFLAGVFGPLTLFWLVLSFILQRKELSQNTKALELQVEELKKSVEQHSQLVQTTKEQLLVDKEMLQQEKVKRDYDLRARFVVRKSGWGSRSGPRINYEFEFENSGAHANHVSIETRPTIDGFSGKKVPYTGSGETLVAQWVTTESRPAPSTIHVTIYFSDPGNARHEQFFTFERDSDDQYILAENPVGMG